MELRLSNLAKTYPASGIRKMFDLAAGYDDVIALTLGEPNFETPAYIKEAAKKALDENYTHYAPNAGLPVLREAIAKRYQKSHWAGYKAENVIVTVGALEGLTLGMLALLNPGDEILVPDPGFANYYGQAKIVGAVPVPVPAHEENGFNMTAADIEKCITPKTKAIMITNPGNPTGTCLTEAQMKMLLDVAVAHDLYLVADEVYREFTYDGEPLHSFGKFDYGQENLILIDSVSKRFSACGARIGCLISKNRELMNHAMKYCQARLSVATLDQIASAALYTVGPEYFAAVRDEYKKRRDTLCRKLGEIPGVVFDVPGGAFYVMAALPVDDADKFQQWLLEEFEDNGDTVMFAPGEPFYATPGKGKNEVRIAYVLKQADLERAMDLLAKGIEAYNKRS